MPEQRYAVPYAVGLLAAVAFALAVSVLSGIVFGVFTWPWFACVAATAVVIRLVTTHIVVLVR